MVDHNEVGGAIYFKYNWRCLRLKWSNQWLTIELWNRNNEVSSKIISLFASIWAILGWKSRIVVEKAVLELKKLDWSWKSLSTLSLWKSMGGKHGTKQLVEGWRQCQQPVSKASVHFCGRILSDSSELEARSGREVKLGVGEFFYWFEFDKAIVQGKGLTGRKWNLYQEQCWRFGCLGLLFCEQVSLLWKFWISFLIGDSGLEARRVLPVHRRSSVKVILQKWSFSGDFIKER